MKELNCDVAILGGGLAGGLIALAINRLHPRKKLLLVEAGETFGGNHYWSFFGSDVAERDRWLVAPLVVQGWRGYDVHFPGLKRTLSTSYYTVSSERLDEVIRERIPDECLMTGVKALATSTTTVVLENGTRVSAGGIIDARGAGDAQALECGWQKFRGATLRLAEPHDLTRPLIMDAHVDQLDGYRFVYCLPLSPVEIFVEDTYYSDAPDLDEQVLDARILAYAGARGWQVEQVVRREHGVLPVVMGGDFNAYWQSTGSRTAKAGVRAGLFQALTSYSLPSAVRSAVSIADMADLSGAALAESCRKMASDNWDEGKFYRQLSAMLFRASEPSKRYRLLERFYRLDQKLIERFYAGQSSMTDKARILSGKPPVPMGKAIQVLTSRQENALDAAE